MGSNAGYSVQAQLRYVVQWFHEWSEMQRSDFLPILAQKFISSGYVNGLVAGLNGLGYHHDRPPSLFQCRIKLFQEWSECWNQTEREQLLNQIRVLDADFVNKFEEEVREASGAGDSKVPSPQLEQERGDTEEEGMV